MTKVLYNQLYNQQKLDLKAGQVIRILRKPNFCYSGDENPVLNSPLRLKYPIEGRIVKMVISGNSDSRFSLEYDNKLYGFFLLFDTEIQLLNEMSII